MGGLWGLLFGADLHKEERKDDEEEADAVEDEADAFVGGDDDDAGDCGADESWRC